jgi:pyruvate formate lyase activating enzyme
MLMDKGIIFNIQRFSLHDGPGIRTVVFLKGCPLKCRWCSNPESQEVSPELSYTSSSCIMCLRCLRVCPQNAINLDEGVINIDTQKCNKCLRCTEVCPSVSLKAEGVEKSLD